MPVQQIVVNPVTLQQTNNKERKVSFSLRNAFLSTLWYRNLAHLTYIRPMKLAEDFSHLFDLFIFDGTIEFSKMASAKYTAEGIPPYVLKTRNL